MNSKDANTKYERNYQLDFLKLMFAFLVIISLYWRKYEILNSKWFRLCLCSLFLCRFRNANGLFI